VAPPMCDPLLKFFARDNFLVDCCVHSGVPTSGPNAHEPRAALCPAPLTIPVD
jgi:hypothetical protein